MTNHYCQRRGIGPTVLRRGARAVACAAAVSLASLPVMAAEDGGTFKISTGLDYSSGDYGANQDTTIWYLPVTVKYETSPLTIKLTVPWLSIRGPGDVVGGGDSVVVVGSANNVKRKTESGLGDVILGFTYTIEPSTNDMPFIDLTAKVKFPTANENRGLGTGEADYTFQVDLAKTYDRFTPMGTLGYKIKGDPSGFNLDNVIFASLGFAYKINPQFSAGAFLDYQEASTKAADDAFEAMIYGSWKLDGAWTLTGYGIAGFTDGSPDEELGFQIGYRFD